MINGPMHEEMSFKIDMSRRVKIENPGVPGGARSRRLKSHSDHCAWSKISNNRVSGEELIDVRKMVIFGGCVHTVRHRRRRDVPQVKLIDAVRPIPIDVPVPGVGTNCQHLQTTC